MNTHKQTTTKTNLIQKKKKLNENKQTKKRIKNK